MIQRDLRADLLRGHGAGARDRRRTEAKLVQTREEWTERVSVDQTPWTRTHLTRQQS